MTPTVPVEARAASKRLERAVRLHRRVAVILLDSLILLVMINGALWVFYHFFRSAPPVVREYGDEAWPDVYPGMDHDNVLHMLQETWSRPMAYEPFTQVKERPFSGKFVNVTEQGFRGSNRQQPWPPDRAKFNVFVFGGSTVFGYGVSDSETLPSYLQETLASRTARDVCVYNFGNGFYRSTQERARFERLLLSGHVPEMAVFVDGLNDFAFASGPAHTAQLAPLFESPGLDTLVRSFGSLPLMRAVRSVRARLAHSVLPASSAAGQDKRILQQVVDLYVANYRLTMMIGEGFGVRTVFVWQPVPNYKYDLRYHPFAKGSMGVNGRAAPGYAYFARRLESEPLGENFIWCADMQESLKEPLYVDGVHYTARMNRLFGEVIVETMEKRGLLDEVQRQRRD